MTAAGKRAAVHAAIAAGALALVGVMYAELASLWVAGQTVQRAGPGPAAAAPAVSPQLRWRLPAAMAAGGFVLVLLGEWALSRWRAPVAPAAEPAGRDFDREAEEKIQQLLREAEGRPDTKTGGPAGPAAP